MAYDYLNDAMDQSNRVQADYQQRNPVIPNAPAPVSPPMVGDPATGVMTPDTAPPPGNGPGLGDVLSGAASAVGRGMDAVMDVQGVRPPWQQNANIDWSLLQPRALPPGTQPGNLTTTPLSTDLIGGSPQSNPISTAAAATPPDYLGIYNNPREADYARQNAANRAQDQQDFMDRRARMSTSADAANARTDRDRLQGEQRVANFNAENARLDLAGNIGGEGRYAAADLAAANAGRVGKEVTAANEALTAANIANNPKSRDYLGDYVKTQGVEDQAARTKLAASSARVDSQGRAIDNQGKQLEVDQKRQVNDIIARLNNPSTPPAERAQLQQSLLAIHGKDATRYQVEHSNGPPVPDAMGGLHPGAQYVHIIDKQGVEPVRSLRADDGAPNRGPSLDDFMKAARADPRNKDRTDAELKAYHAKTYGGGN